MHNPDYPLKSILALFLFLLASCKPAQIATTEKTPDIPVREHSIQAVLWQQQSAEYKALCLQAYNVAKMQLDKIKSEVENSDKPLAIITDIDETVLDNSPFNGQLIFIDEEYTNDQWYAWGKKRNAKSVPGAVAFFNYANDLGFEIFYISNRDEVQLEETIDNLNQLNFPQVEKDHILLKGATSEKQPRRDIVLANHQVVMLLGDNLADFRSVFEGTDRMNYLNESKDDFGSRFIVFPNPMYGNWETKGIYEGSYEWNAQQKDSIRRSKVTGF